VKDGLRSVTRLNELEFINGEILANVWYKDQIARIDPRSGKVIGWLDLSAIRPDSVRHNREATLNGIAWDADRRRLFVTGKYWPRVFEITF
jgi:glutamine cyclotransferase